MSTEDHFNGLFGCFERVEWCAFTTGEGLTTALAFEILDIAIVPSFTVANQRMYGLVNYPEIVTGGIDKGKPPGWNGFFCIRMNSCAYARVAHCDELGLLSVRCQSDSKDNRQAIWVSTDELSHLFSATTKLGLMSDSASTRHGAEDR